MADADWMGRDWGIRPARRRHHVVAALAQPKWCETHGGFMRISGVLFSITVSFGGCRWVPPASSSADTLSIITPSGTTCMCTEHGGRRGETPLIQYFDTFGECGHKLQACSVTLEHTSSHGGKRKKWVHVCVACTSFQSFILLSFGIT